MATKWMDSPTAKVDTPAGALNVTVNGGPSAYQDEPYPMHAYCATEPYAINADHTDGAGLFRINGVDYTSIRVDLSQYPDGWALTREPNGYDGRAISGARGWSGELTDSAARYIRKSVVPVLVAYLDAHPDLVERGRLASAYQALHGLERDITTKVAELDALKHRRDLAQRIVAESTVTA